LACHGIYGYTPGIDKTAEAKALAKLTAELIAVGIILPEVVIPRISAVVWAARAAEGAVAAAEEGSMARGGVYILRDIEGGVVRSGRTNDLVRRGAEHLRDPVLKDYDFEVVYRTDVYN
jgi:hypothetical protein